MPPAAVYFVKPLRMAAMPPSLTGNGVSKYGSPEAKSITYTPRATIALASAVMRSVAEGEVRPTRRAIFTVRHPAGVLPTGGRTRDGPGRSDHRRPCPV